MVLLFVNSNSNSIFKSFYDINTAKINLFRITINTLDKYLEFKPILTVQKGWMMIIFIKIVMSLSVPFPCTSL